MRITAATRSVRGEGAVDRELPNPVPQAFPHQSTRSHRACPAPSCHLAFSASSIIQHLLFITRKTIFHGSELKKQNKKTTWHSWPWARVPFPLLSGSFLISRPCPPPSDSVPTPTLPGQKLRFTLTAGGFLWGTGRRGGGCYSEGSHSHLSLPAMPAGYDSSPKCQ